MKIFVPFSEDLGGKLIAELGPGLHDLVPFQLDYQCLRLGEDFSDAEAQPGSGAWEGQDE